VTTPGDLQLDTDVQRGLIGDAVRRQRKARGLTMVQLAGATELSQGFISRIETGRDLPSVMTIYRLADALGCPPATLMPSPAADNEYRVVRSGEALSISEQPARDLNVTLLGRAGPNDQIEAYIYQFEHHTTEWWPYRQESLLYVLEGTVVVEFADGDEIRLERGDSLHFNQDVPARFVAPDGPARMLGCHGAPMARHDLEAWAQKMAE